MRMAPHSTKMAGFVSVLFVVAVGVPACGGGAASGVTLGKKIAFLLPDSQSSRYETRDAPIFEAKIKGMCSDCTVDYRNAHGDAPAQLTQAEAALAGGANRLLPHPLHAPTPPPLSPRPRTPQGAAISHVRICPAPRGA